MPNVFPVCWRFSVWGWMYKVAVTSCAGHRKSAETLRSFYLSGVLERALLIFETMAIGAIHALLHCLRLDIIISILFDLR